jgi:hypothetical protein
MRSPDFYLGEGEFTTQGDAVRYASSQIKGKYIPEGVNEFVKHLAFRPEEKNKLFRKRTSDDIIKDGFVTGCTDSALVFCALLRIKRVPAAYVETLGENFLENEIPVINGHVFSDFYKGGIWIPFNPRNGRTIKLDKTYLFLPNSKDRRYIEKGRGLDFSELYLEDFPQPFRATTIKEILYLLED